MEKMTDEALEKSIEALRRAYRKEKEKMEWTDNDFEASMVAEEMERLKTKIKRLRGILKERKEKQRPA
ncbi:hypothetical protein [Hydrogenimonas urashimensis]|uniref:hypothetical protein n=1 Tax=Hydrogenimonas urashimensis TaxID=2740515 RepID=UPI001915382A|nr:hypothetical protein [Hydrogenimonas urashimensis]